MATLKRGRWAAVAVAASAACSTTVEPGADRVVLAIVARPIPADTIEAPIGDTMVLRLRRGGVPIPEATIRVLGSSHINAPPTARPPFLWIRRLPAKGADTAFQSTDLALTTDGAGEVRILARRGWYAGRDYLLAAAPIYQERGSGPFQGPPRRARR